MLIIRIEGGLANRMFQYAFFLAIAQVRKDVFLDETSFKPRLKHEFFSLLQVFPHLQFPTTKLNRFKCETKNNVLSKLMRSFLEKYSRQYFHESEFKHYPHLIDNLPSVCYLRGYWQTEKYFSHIKNEICDAFVFPVLNDSRNQALLNNMGLENSVAIHVRKGADYVSEGLSVMCGVQYYQNAINYIKKNIENPRFYVFTDNKTWVLENIKGVDYVLVDWNPISGSGSHIDMQLMSAAKHNIIANSSYSWWGAWLNKNISKIVIAPRVWFDPNSKIKSAPDIIPDNWIKL